MSDGVVLACKNYGRHRRRRGRWGDENVDESRVTRQSERVALGFDEGIWSEINQTDAERSHGVITVLGARGALVKVLETNDRFAVGSSLSLRFQLPGTTDYIRCGCVVRNQISNYDIGVEFTLISATHREQLAQTIGYWRFVAAA